MALLEAYWREFEGVTDVALVIKTYVDNFTPDRRQEIDNAIKKAVEYARSTARSRGAARMFGTIKIMYKGVLDEPGSS